MIYRRPFRKNDIHVVSGPLSPASFIRSGSMEATINARHGPTAVNLPLYGSMYLYVDTSRVFEDPSCPKAVKRDYNFQSDRLSETEDDLQ